MLGSCGPGTWASHFHLVEAVVAGFVDARRLAGRADILAREQHRQRRVPLPVDDDALQEVGPAHERRIVGCRAAQNHVVAAARAGMAPVGQELVGTEPHGARLLVEAPGDLDGVVPTGCGLHVDLDHARVGRDLHDLKARIVGRTVALDVDREAEVGRRPFDGGKQFEVVLQPVERRHEHMELPLARFDRDGSADFGVGPVMVGGGVLERARGARLRDRRELVRVWQRGARLGRILRGRVGKARRRDVVERFQRQAEAERRIAGHQEHVLAPGLPHFTGPIGPPTLNRYDEAHWRGEATIEHAGDAGPLLLRADGRLEGVDLARQRGFLQQPMGRILVGVLHVVAFEPEPVRDGLHQAPRVLDPGAPRAGLLGDEVGVAPDRFAVPAPVEREGPARQALAGIPLALAVVKESAGREARAQATDEAVGEPALARAQGLGVPFGRLEVVDRNEGRLAARGQADIAGPEVGVDPLAEPVERLPGLVREGQRDARRLRHARDLHSVLEGDLARVESAADRCRGAVVRGRRERDVALAAEQARCGVEADPAGARHVDLGPGMEIGEVVTRAQGAGYGVDIGSQLDQIARDEAGREPELAKQLHHQPGRVPARAGFQRQGLFGRLHARFQADHVGDLVRQPRIEVDQEVDGALGLEWQRCQERPGVRPGRFGFDIGRDLGPGLGVIGEREGLGTGLDEEVERVDHRHLGREIDLDPELFGLVREDEAGQPVAVRILLPIDEMMGRRDLQRIARHFGPAMRGRAEPDHLRAERHRTVVAIVGDVIDRGAHRHRGLLEDRGGVERAETASAGQYGAPISSSTVRRAQILCPRLWPWLRCAAYRRLQAGRAAKAVLQR